MAKKKSEPVSFQDKLDVGAVALHQDMAQVHAQVITSVANKDPLAEIEPPKARTELEVWKLRALEAEARAARLEVEVKIAQRQAFVREAEARIRALDEEIKNLAVKAADAEAGLAKAQE